MNELFATCKKTANGGARLKRYQKITFFSLFLFLLLCQEIFCQDRKKTDNVKEFKEDYKVFFTAGMNLYYGGFWENFGPTASPLVDLKLAISEVVLLNFNYTGISVLYDWSSKIKGSDIFKTGACVGLRVNREPRSYVTFGIVNFYSGRPVVETASGWVEAENWTLGRDENTTFFEFGLMNVCEKSGYVKLSLLLSNGQLGFCFEPVFSLLKIKSGTENMSIGCFNINPHTPLIVSMMYCSGKGWYAGISIVNFYCAKVNLF